jgi:2-methylisocitrate lyase-like PEP mutase family enzyme
MGITQNETADRFRAHHNGPGTFVIPNPWDVGSAQMLAGRKSNASQWRSGFLSQFASALKALRLKATVPTMPRKSLSKNS